MRLETPTVEKIIKQKQPKKRITLDDLAVMLKRQFDSIEEKMATKDDVNELSGRIGSLEKRFDVFEKKFATFEKRFDVIDNIVLNDHRLRIRALEKEVGI